MNQQKQKQPPKKQIFDEPKNDNIGITLWTDETIQAITKNSGKLTRGNEYQVHYWALNIRIQAKDESILDISIPTLFFNYEQQVNSAHIDFELDDVDNVSNALEPIHNIEVNKLMPLVKAQFENMAQNEGITIDYSSKNLNSLHRHPGGRRQSFSGTDYNKDAKAETGIVFPLSEGERKANFASIIAHDEGKTYLAHTEYRLANGKIDKDKGEITYSKGRCVSFVKSPKHTVSDIEKMFGYVDQDLSYGVSNNLDTKESDVFQFLISWWNQFDYQPNTDFIKEQNLSVKVYKKQTQARTTVVPPTFGKAYGKQQEMVFNDAGDTYPLVKVIRYASEIMELELPHPIEFEEMGQDEMQLAFNQLEVYYYGIDPEEVENISDPEMLEAYGITMDAITLEDMIELYNNVVDELTDQMSEEDGIEVEYEDATEISEMRNDLIQLGARPDAIKNASEAMVRQWHKEIFEV